MTGLLIIAALAAPPATAPPATAPPAKGPAAPAAKTASGVLSLSLDEARQLALTKSHVLTQQTLQAEETTARVKEAKAALWPRVDLQASYTRNIYAPNPFAGSGASGILGGLFSVGWLQNNEQARIDQDPATNPLTLREYLERYQAGRDAAGIVDADNPFLVENQFVVGASVTQVLYNGAAFAATRAAEALFEQTAAAHEVEALRVLEQVSQTYLRVLLANERAKVLDKSIARVEAALGETKARVERETLPKFAQLTAEVQLANLDTQRAIARDAARGAREQLAVAIGLPPDRALRLTDTLVAPTFVEPPSFGDAYQKALANRPDLAQLRRGMRTAQAQVDVASAAFLPVFEAFANASYLGQVPDDRTVSSADPMDPFTFNTSENDFFDSNYWNANVSAGLRLRWTAFDGFARDARVEQAEVAARRLQAQDAQMRDIVRMEVLGALRTLETAAQRLTTQEKNIARAELNYEHAQARVKEGVSTRAELREANELLDESRFNHLQAVHDYQGARIRLDVVMGTRPGDSK